MIQFFYIIINSEYKIIKTGKENLTNYFKDIFDEFKIEKFDLVNDIIFLGNVYIRDNNIYAKNILQYHLLNEWIETKFNIKN